MNRLGSFTTPALLAIFFAFGCGSQVDVGAASESTSGAGSTGAGGACDPANAPGLTKALLGAPSSGVFMGDYLHLSTPLDGAPEGYVVLQLAAGAGFVVATPQDLAGPANLAPAGQGRHARLRASDTSTNVDVVDTSNPAKPILIDSLSIPDLVPSAWQTVFSVIDGDQLLACFRPSPDEDAVLSKVALSPTAQPIPIPPSSSYQPCGGFVALDHGTARGATWLSWGAEADLRIFDVTSSAVTSVAEYLYNPNGVHAYGPVLSASTDGSRVAFDIGHDSRFFLYPLGSGDGTVTHVYLGIKGPKRLLGVVNQIAYLATTSGVRAYDLTDVPGPSAGDDAKMPLLDFHADIDFGEGLATLIASDGQRLAVIDSEGRFYVVPLDRSGAVSPLEVYLGPPPALPDECAP